LTVTLIWLFAFIALYWVYCLFWGVVSARMAKTSDDFFIGARTIPSWIFVLSATAISFSGWTMLGQPALIFRDGFQYSALALCAITIPLTGVLFLKRQWILGKRFGYITQAEMLTGYFGGQSLRILTLLVAITFAIPFVGMQLAASGYLIQVLSDGAIHWSVAMWVVSAAMFLYVCLGGMRAAAYVGALQCMLFAAGMVAVGVIAYVRLGGFNEFIDVLAKFASSGMGPLASEAKGYNAYFEIPGVVQFVAGIGREAPAGGIWTAAMILSYSFALMGIQAAPAFTIWAFSSRDPKGFAPQQVWVSGVAIGVILIFFGVAQGMGANFLGASAAANEAGLAVARVLPELGPGKQSELVIHYIHTLGANAPWLMALLAVCVLAVIHAVASAYVSATGTMFARDVYKVYLNPEAGDRPQKFFARIAIGLIVLAALLLATFAPRAQIELGSLALGFGCQLLPALAGICWLRWITREGAAVGLAAGLATVIITDSFGLSLAGFFGFEMPWGRWPWTIHSAGWGIFVNVVLCILVSWVSQNPAQKAHRAKYHAFLDQTAATASGHYFLRPVAWTFVLAWLFFAVGPGAVIGNTLFSLPDGGSASWALGMPSIWVWQIIWWAFGVLVLWLLAYRLDMSTMPRRDIERESDTFKITRKAA
jgi:SSS family solute:Na+ symporter